MELLFLLLFGLIFPFIERLMFKFNPFLYIDLCLGRKNFVKFIKEHYDYFK